MDDVAYIEHIKGTRYVKTALYRHFDADGQLLYVGISNDALRRLCQHKDRSHWYAQIKRVEVEQFDDRASAFAAEARAIVDERPAWNVRGRDALDAKPRTLDFKKPASLKAPPNAVAVASAPKATHPAAGGESEPWTLRDPARPLVGMFFHTFDDNWNLKYQGHILSVDGDVALAQMFEWFMGEPSNVMPFDKAFLYSDKCRLYATADAWRDWADSTQAERWSWATRGRQGA